MLFRRPTTRGRDRASLGKKGHVVVPIVDLSLGTLTRPSPATHWDGALLTRYDPGMLRMVMRNGVRGYVLEPQRTNECAVSNDLTNSIWGSTFDARAFGFPDPAGGNGATRVTSLGGTDTLTRVIPFTPSTDYTLSLFMRSVSGDTTVRIYVRKLDGTFPTLADVTLTPQWQRFLMPSFNSLTGADASPGIRIQSFNGLAKVFDVFGVQMELGLYATSLIETFGTTATRAADDLRGFAPSTVMDSNWYSYWRPDFTMAQRGAATPQVWLDTGVNAARFQLDAGSPTAVPRMTYTGIADAPRLAAWSYALGDILKVTSHGAAGSLTIEGSTTFAGTNNDLGSPMIYTPGTVNFKVLQTTGANGTAGWVSDIYPATPATAFGADFSDAFG